MCEEEDIVICAKCEKVITGKITSALGKKWHPEHFTCAHCDKPISDKKVYHRNNIPYCEQDYLDIIAYKCAACNQPIVGAIVDALEKKWHPNHFCCSHCKKVLENEVFRVHEDKPYCSDDYLKLFVPKCNACGKGILRGKVYFKNDKSYCTEDYLKLYAPVCVVCQIPIEGNFTTALNHSYHLDCFRCEGCQEVIRGNSFMEQKQKPYCKSCAEKLKSINQEQQISAADVKIIY